MNKRMIGSTLAMSLIAFNASSAEVPLHHIGAELGSNNIVISYNHFSSGLYGTVRYDRNEYDLGNKVSVCNDGSISGSTGSGTCSGHGGVSHTRNEKNERLGGSLGYLWNVIGDLYLGGGANFGAYTSEVNVGNKSQGETYFNVEARAAYRITPHIAALTTYDAEVKAFTFGASIGF